MRRGWLASTTVLTTNKNHRFKVSALTEQGNNAEFDGGDILPSEYDRQRYDLAYGYQTGAHKLELALAVNETGDTGTPALPMDIDYIDSDLANLSYQYAGNKLSLNGKLYYSDIEHGMTNYHLRIAPTNPMMHRRNIANAENLGFKLDSKISEGNSVWLFGVDGHHEEHDANIDNPNNAMFFVTGFNQAERQVLGAFVEHQQSLNDSLSTELGLRYNHVSMDADKVDGTPAMMSMMGMAPGMTLRDQFNNSDRSHSDNNIDWVARLNYQASNNSNYFLGLARKTRSASYQERYLWLPLEATGGLADGNTYTGNLELDPEVAHEIELGLDYSSNSFSIAPRIFYRDIDNYIQGTATTNMQANMFVNMMNMMNGSNNNAPLEFNNVDAKIYGADVQWRYQIDTQWSLSGLINYVRGKRKDVDDSLYRIAPSNTTLAIDYQGSNWAGTVEMTTYNKQDKVSDTNHEQQTAGYSLLNARAHWQLSETIRIGLGVNNLTDKRYQDHLGGYNRVMGNADIAVGERLYGYGRNAYLRADLEF